MTEFQTELKNYLLGQGAADVGFCRAPDGTGGLQYAVSIVARLSDAIVEEIHDAPTYTYFHHYRTVNTFLDQLALKAGLRLQQRGYRYLTIAASQSIPKAGSPYQGRYSHKKAAVLAGLGTVGKNNLFLHERYGPRVRLSTVFTDCVFTGPRASAKNRCMDCGRCVHACPAQAISGESWSDRAELSSFFAPKLCSDYMKHAFQHIGRGAVCGICMRVCPAGRTPATKESER